jgi:hypothetical protein
MIKNPLGGYDNENLFSFGLTANGCIWNLNAQIKQNLKFSNDKKHSELENQKIIHRL